ncbi:EthD family reductase [Geodermatophilus sp. SYSU D00705]
MFDVFAIYASPEDPAAFDAHYRDVHAPLTRAMPGLLEFTWGHGDDPSAYVVARMTFASGDAADAAFTSPEGAAAAADLATFAGAGVSLVRVPRADVAPVGRA